jgi:hypothetical protein
MEVQNNGFVPADAAGDLNNVQASKLYKSSLNHFYALIHTLYNLTVHVAVPSKTP